MLPIAFRQVLNLLFGSSFLGLTPFSYHPRRGYLSAARVMDAPELRL